MGPLSSPVVNRRPNFTVFAVLPPTCHRRTNRRNWSIERRHYALKVHRPPKSNAVFQRNVDTDTAYFDDVVLTYSDEMLLQNAAQAAFRYGRDARTVNFLKHISVIRQHDLGLYT